MYLKLWLNSDHFLETSESYEFLRRMQDGRRIMRGGRDLNRYGENSIPFLDQHGFKNVAFENRFQHNPFPTSSMRGKAEPYHSFPFLSVHNAPRPRQDSEHISFLAGMRIIRPNKSPHKYSGYQVVRLATEIIPTYTALLGMCYLINPYYKTSNKFHIYV